VARGSSSVIGFLDKLAERNALYARWSPKLRDFAQECRRANPIPDLRSLPYRERAKLPIYRTRIQAREPQPRSPWNELVICRLPLIAMPIAQRLWPGHDDQAVFLTADEFARWEESYQHPENAFWWFTHYWWSIDDPPESDGPWALGEPLTVGEGADPWLVVSGVSWSDWAGGETAEHWEWNGEVASFVRDVGVCDF
jgi:hypothetical protein